MKIGIEVLSLEANKMATFPGSQQNGYFPRKPTKWLLSLEANKMATFSGRLYFLWKIILSLEDYTFSRRLYFL